MINSEIENIEISLLLEATYNRYGYDFRDYARASIERRVRQFAIKSGIKSISEMIPILLYNESFFQTLVREFSITVTEMFRDPKVYHVLKEKVFPILKTYPFIKIWHAGCATGEEVYSLAILLMEAGLYKKSTIFATDFNDEALATAKQGIYPTENIKQSTLNYQKAGGLESFSDYYHAKYDSISIDNKLKKNITFANHNLVIDQTFSEMHLILCRNVLIYFNKTLQDKVFYLFDNSLVSGGFLCLGSKESLLYSGIQGKFEPVDEKEKIYQKTYLGNRIYKTK